MTKAISGHLWHSGELTRGEARHLEREARDVRREERIYRSDGFNSRDGRTDLYRDRNAASQHIYIMRRTTPKDGECSQAKRGCR